VSKRWMKLGVGALAAAGAGFLVITAWFVVRAAPVGTGFTAKYLCSSYFIAGQDPRRAFSEDVAPVNPLAGWPIRSRPPPRPPGESTAPFSGSTPARPTIPHGACGPAPPGIHLPPRDSGTRSFLSSPREG
jgi:hypothetical protein